MKRFKKTIQEQLEQLQKAVHGDFVKVWGTLDKTVSKDIFLKMGENMKKTHDQVTSDQAYLKGELFALAEKIDAQIHEISRDMDQGKKKTPTPKNNRAISRDF